MMVYQNESTTHAQECGCIQPPSGSSNSEVHEAHSICFDAVAV